LEEPPHDSAVNKERIETFSDGVFAIAITLLVLTIAQPTDYRSLGHELADKWPSLAAYVVSFLVIGIMWLNHHTIFSHLERLDRGLFYLNLALLMTIVFIPYPTEVFGTALQKGQDARTAAVFYGAVMAVNASIWVGLWLYASLGRRLLEPDFPESERKSATVLFIAGSFVYISSIGLALISPYVFLAFQAALAAYYALDPISRRVRR
jgi:uncharacterized membrane protein